MALVRLNKYIASTGHCSRREADTLIEEGEVYVNNFLTTTLGTKIDDEKDIVRVGKKEIKPKSAVVIALNKPKNIVCTKKATHGEKTIMQLLPGNLQYLNPVGRLDKDSEGLILLTNDGKLAERLMHPKQHVEKEYIVTVKGQVTPEVIANIEKGVKMIGYTIRGTKAKLIHPGAERSVINIILQQGKKRQIREMMFRLGFRVKKLVRVRIGKYHLDPKMPLGAFVYLSENDLKLLV